MSSIQQVVAHTKQPRSGYLDFKLFSIKLLEDARPIPTGENVQSHISERAVKCLSLMMNGLSVEDAFRLALLGANEASMYRVPNVVETANELLSGIDGLSDASITSACKLVTLETWYKSSLSAMMQKGPETVSPDHQTIENIRVMANRSLQFFEEYGPILRSEFELDTEGYTAYVSSGSVDLLTANTLWLYRTSRQRPNIKDTLRLLMSWIMWNEPGVDAIGIFNPRLNAVYTMHVSDIPAESIELVKSAVIGYE